MKHIGDIQRYYDNWEYKKCTDILLDVYRADNRKFIPELYYILIYSLWQLWDNNLAIKFIEESNKNNINSPEISEIKLFVYSEIWYFEKVRLIIKELDSISYVSERFFIFKYVFYREVWLYTLSKNSILAWIKYYPNSSIMNYNIWNSLYQEWDLKAALFYYDKSLQSWEYYYSYCKKLRILNISWKKQEFNILYEIVLEKLNSSNAWDKNVIYGNLYYEKKLYINSIDEYKKYCTIKKNDTYSLNSIWNCYYKLWNYNAAIYYYRKSHLLNNKITYPLLGIAKCLINQEKYTKSATICKNILILDKNNFTVNYLLWKTFYLEKKIKKSRLYFLKANKLNSEHQMCKRYLEKLNEKAIAK